MWGEGTWNEGMWNGETARSLIPMGEELHQALRWIAEKQREYPSRRLAHLVTEASRRFDLSPADDKRLLDDLGDEESVRLH
jgi:hypothetical protein